jgi:dTDP-4-dehydrorhamnose 3,5-epimerase
VLAEPLALSGALLLRGTEHVDSRGWFRKLAEIGDLPSDVRADVQQVGLAHNERAGTVRGLHLQAGPEPECKFVWCLSGSLQDVIVDARPESPTYGDWVCVDLDAIDARGVYVPSGCAHGYQTKTDDTTVLYLITAPYRPDASLTFRWDDPQLGIPWPLPLTDISMQDEEAPPWPPPSW